MNLNYVLTSKQEQLGVPASASLQWNLSTRDKLGTGQLSLIHLSTRDKSVVPNTVEPLYKGQVGDRS